MSRTASPAQLSQAQPDRVKRVKNEEESAFLHSFHPHFPLLCLLLVLVLDVEQTNHGTETGPSCSTSPLQDSILRVEERRN